MALLGESLLGQESYPEAEPMLLSGYNGMVANESPGPLESKQLIQRTLENIVQLYTKTDQLAEVTKWNKVLDELKQDSQLDATP
jgi:hypothetical protein